MQVAVGVFVIYKACVASSPVEVLLPGCFLGGEGSSQLSNPDWVTVDGWKQ